MNQPPPELDAVDLRILRALQDDGDVATGEIAQRVSLSQSACWRRMTRMRELGIIKRRAYVLNRQALGFDIVAFVRIKLRAYDTASLARFEREAVTVANIQELQLISSENAYRLRVVARSMEDYERLFRSVIANLPGVQDVQASLVVSEIKYGADLPLD